MAQCSSTVEEAELLGGENDNYGGFVIDPCRLPDDPSIFLERLRRSISRWKFELKMGIWLKLPTKYAELVPIAIKLLVVQEVTGPTKGSGTWKMPTGVVLQREDIQDAAVREVKEETGVDAKFVEVFGVRQSHGVAFGKSDLFFVCLLQPLSSDIVIQKHEIAAAQWMPFDDYRSQEANTKSELLTRIADIVTAAFQGKYTGFGVEKLRLSPRSKRAACFHHNTRDIDSYLKDGKRSS